MTGQRPGTTQRRSRVVVLDHDITSQSPAGSCVLAEVEALLAHHDVTVVAHDVDPRLLGRVDWLRVPLPRGPVIARYVAFAAQAPARVARARRAAAGAPVVVQATEGQYAGADVCYSHFCHRAYLERYWTQQTATGLRRLMRRLNFAFNAWSERRAFERCRTVVAVSNGLAREIEETYPFLRGRVTVVPNPIDVERFARPADHDRAAARAAAGLPVDARIVAFTALGDFARKGLGVLIDAIAAHPDPSLVLLVVGGKQAAEVATFEALARERGIADRVRFAGMQSDVPKWLWLADVFALPSVYETFSLVTVQAAAAGLPVIATRLHGVEDWLVAGENGWLVERDAASVRAALADAFADPRRLAAMGERAALAALRFGTRRFGQAWLELLADELDAKGAGPSSGTHASQAGPASRGASA